MNEIPDPEQCTTMAEVRSAVDEIDQRILRLIALRFRFMEAAARIKPDRGLVRDEQRKADVLAKVDQGAGLRGLDRPLIARLYDQLIESCIAHELEAFDRLRR